MKIRAKFIGTLKAVLILAALIIFAASCLQQAEKTDLTITATNAHSPTTTRVLSPSQNYGRFNHVIKEHDELDCASCHQRQGPSIEIKLGGHESCIGCHINEFTTASTSAMCSICHQDLQTIPPSVKSFPVKFKEGFNMKFEHASHIRGEGLPPEGCASCHQPARSAQTIPSGIDSHANCLTCHTPESEIGSCSICHQLAPYNRTPPIRAVFRGGAFSHADHTASRGVNCAECHSVRASGGQGRQVSTPVAVQHFGSSAAVSCRTCHNDSRAFGDLNFANCKRCHTGGGFNLLPGGKSASDAPAGEAPASERPIGN